MVTTLFLIRHGETEGAEKRRYKGTIDVPLSEKGARQMERVSRFLSAEVRKFKSAEVNRGLSVYCSDLSRAIKSAEIIARPHFLEPVIIAALRERNLGVWEDMSFEEIRERYPEEFDAWTGNPLEFSPMGGESTLVMRDRVTRALNEIIADHAGECVVAVSHGGVIRIILCHFLGIPLENIFRIEQDYAAVNVVEIWDQYPVVKLINGKFKCRRQKKEVFEGNPVESGSCPATVKGTKAYMPLSISGWEGRRVDASETSKNS